MGLVQREIEAAGFTTVILSNIPDLTAAVCVPRLVAIEHPFGQNMGAPGDADRQREVLWGALQAVQEMEAPGAIRHLPYEWVCEEGEVPPGPPQPPPIVGHLVRHPWQVRRLLNREVPE